MWSTSPHFKALGANKPSSVVQKKSARSRRTLRLSTNLVKPPVPGKTPSKGSSGKDTELEPSSTMIISSQASANSYPPPAQAPSMTQRYLRFDLWLAFSPIKSNYQNFMIQKATELGVTKFLPIIFDRTVVRKINKERLEKIVIEASEQSNRINVPSIESPQTLDIFLKKNSMDLIFTDLNSDNIKVDKSKLTDKPVCIIIGPEGDFSEAERDKILSFKDVQSVKINENILRSETAVISAISIVNYVIN